MRAPHLAHLEMHAGGDQAVSGMSSQQGCEGVAILAVLPAPLLTLLSLSFCLSRL
jgi:hypothetical protein